MSKLPNTLAASDALAESMARILDGTHLALRSAAARRKARRQLAQLSDQQLRDIGLTRANVRQELASPMRRYHSDL